MTESHSTAYLPFPRPISKHAMETALQWMESARERLRKFEKKSVSIEEKMEEIRIVNKAKWLLKTRTENG